MTTLRVFLISVAWISIMGCGDGRSGDPDGGLPDGGDADADADAEVCPELDPFDSGDDGVTDLTLPPATGNAVAGRITSEDQLLRGLKPKGKVGDFLLANEHVALVIEDARASDGYGTGGGEILDVDLVGPDGALGESRFNELLMGVFAEVIEADDVSVLADGSDGGAAIVRVKGRLAPVWLLEECCEFLFPRFLRLPAALDYVLEPDAESVSLRITVRNDTTVVDQVAAFLTVVIAGDGMVRYAHGVGFDEGADFGTQDFLGFVGERISYAWVVDRTRPLTFMISEGGVHIYQTPGELLPECGDSVFDLGQLVVAEGDTSRLEAAIRRVRGEEALAAIVGQVTETDGTPVAGARVHATSSEGEYLGMARADAEGRYRIELPSGDALVQAWIENRWPTEQTAAHLGGLDVTADLAFGPAGMLAWVVRDGDGTEIPAKVSVIPVGRDAPAAPDELGEPDHPYGAVIHDFSLPGTNERRLTAGTYRVVASRGYEYETAEVEVEVVADETALAELTLVRSVDTTGWLCGDFHIHTMYSPDSNDLATWKVAAAASVGLELPVSTDHRYRSDLQPVAEDLGLTEWLQWIPGHEITTVTYGHFNEYPVAILPDEPNMGATEWVGRTAPELFQAVSDLPEEPILQINHPRSGSAMGGYFVYAGLDPDTAEVTNPDGWSTDFDAIEVFNGSGWTSNRDDTVRDWFGLLNHGVLVPAIGNSDSHNAEWSDVGYPRTYLDLGTDAPAEVTEEMLRDAVRAGRCVVSGGLFITARTDDGVGPGGVADASDGSTMLHVRVQAPVWMDADHAEVIVDGVTTESVELDESTEDPENPVVRLDRDVELELSEDAWVVVAAWSDGTLDPATRGQQPFGVTNPIYLDVDGDGVYADSGREVE